MALHNSSVYTRRSAPIRDAEEFVKTLEDNLENLLDELRELMSPSEEEA
jgi:hypothetical protein